MEKHKTVHIKPTDRYLSPLDVWAMSLGCMVGWGVFAMPANAFKEDEEAAIEAGMQDHIAKPIDVNVMMKALARVLK